LFFR